MGFYAYIQVIRVCKDIEQRPEHPGADGRVRVVHDQVEPFCIQRGILPLKRRRHIFSTTGEPERDYLVVQE